MPKYTRSELVDYLKIDKSTISKAVKKGKVILTGKLIDSSLVENKYFMEKHLSRQAPEESTTNSEENELIPLFDDGDIYDQSLEKSIAGLMEDAKKLGIQLIPIPLVKVFLNTDLHEIYNTFLYRELSYLKLNSIQKQKVVQEFTDEYKELFIKIANGLEDMAMEIIEDNQ